MNVLALQGGGVLGYGQALILSELERRAGRPICELFGMIAGTSVGSINGAVLSIGVPATTLETFYTKDAPLIFSTSWINDAESFRRPKYKADSLEAGLMQLLGNKTLADCKTIFIATSYDFATDRPVYFLSHEKSSESKNFIVIGNDSPMELWQICRASSAAQTYFPAYQCGGMTLMDGGNAGDNAPDMLLATEAVRLGKSFRMLSLGSGDSKWSVEADDMVNPSKIRAGLETIEIVFSAGESAAIFKAGRLIGSGYYRLSPDLGDGLAIDDALGVLEKMPMAVKILLDANGATLDEFCDLAAAAASQKPCAQGAGNGTAAAPEIEP